MKLIVFQTLHTSTPFGPAGPLNPARPPRPYIYILGTTLIYSILECKYTLGP